MHQRLMPGTPTFHLQYVRLSTGLILQSGNMSLEGASTWLARERKTNLSQQLFQVSVICSLTGLLYSYSPDRPGTGSLNLLWALQVNSCWSGICHWFWKI